MFHKNILIGYDGIIISNSMFMIGFIILVCQNDYMIIFLIDFHTLILYY